MADRLLRHKTSGILYVWQAVYAARDDFEEVVPDPIPEAAPEPLKLVGKPKAPKGGLKVETPDETHVSAEEALRADASRGA